MLQVIVFSPEIFTFSAFNQVRRGEGRGGRGLAARPEIEFL